MPTAQITSNQQHVANGVALLVTQFKEKPRMTALLAAFLNEGQQIENALYSLLQRVLPTATGITLDTIGKIVGQTRQGMLDAQYVQFLQARIKTNLSDGRVETLISITLLLVGLTSVVLVRDFDPKAIEIEVDNVAVNAYAAWSQFLNIAKDAGTKLNFIFSKSPAAQTFKWTSSHSSTLTTTTTQRYGSSWTVGTGGGVMAGLFG